MSHDNFESERDRSVGFDTAVSIATEAVDRLHTTAEAHHRIMVVEVMGRYSGWIALHSGIAGGADVILIPEILYNLATVAEHILERERLGVDLRRAIRMNVQIPPVRFMSTVSALKKDPVCGPLHEIRVTSNGAGRLQYHRTDTAECSTDTEINCLDAAKQTWKYMGRHDVPQSPRAREQQERSRTATNKDVHVADQQRP